MTAGPDEASTARDGRTDDAVPQPRAAPTQGSPAAWKRSPTPPAAPQAKAARLPSDPPPRPRIVDEPGILGLSRLSRSRFGSRVFTWFFVLVFTVIVIQMIYAIFDNKW